MLFSTHKKKSPTYNTGLWLLPFASFIAGYLFFAYRHQPQKIVTPSLVGKNMPDTIRILTSNNLTIKILTEKTDPDLPDGTIVSQSPSAGSVIKEHQTLFVVITKKPACSHAPNCVHLTWQQIKEELARHPIPSSWHGIPAPFPRGTCFAQYPQPGEQLSPGQHLMLYLALPTKKPVLWPDFSKHSLSDGCEFLKAHALTPTILYPEEKPHTHHDYTIIDQHPRAGTLIVLDGKHPPHIQFQVQ